MRLVRRLVLLVGAMGAGIVAAVLLAGPAAADEHGPRTDTDTDTATVGGVLRSAGLLPDLLGRVLPASPNGTLPGNPDGSWPANPGRPTPDRDGPDRARPGNPDGGRPGNPDRARPGMSVPEQAVERPTRLLPVLPLRPPAHAPRPTEPDVPGPARPAPADVRPDADEASPVNPGEPRPAARPGQRPATPGVPSAVVDPAGELQGPVAGVGRPLPDAPAVAAPTGPGGGVVSCLSELLGGRTTWVTGLVSELAQQVLPPVLGLVGAVLTPVLPGLPGLPADPTAPPGSPIPPVGAAPLPGAPVIPTAPASTAPVSTAPVPVALASPTFPGADGASEPAMASPPGWPIATVIPGTSGPATSAKTQPAAGAQPSAGPGRPVPYGDRVGDARAGAGPVPASTHDTRWPSRVDGRHRTVLTSVPVNGRAPAVTVRPG
ncbi:hypothetical protein [Micromonospora sp. RTGN7]|uniref:hypothetical protein n=1 Tax=Micromonospora sp. RTGN7 TaxID=3016526 RepID=UPI0029FF2404|nr:hypothetical protein [Micromonospora sp. RTGN7]